MPLRRVGLSHHFSRLNNIWKQSYSLSSYPTADMGKGEAGHSSHPSLMASNAGADLTREEKEAAESLLPFYKQKMHEHEDELAALVARVVECETFHEDAHRTKYELKQREDEIKALQRALSDAQTYLFDEREELLKVYAENDRLKVQELEDRLRIKDLLSLTQPVKEDITYFRGRVPEKVTAFPNKRTEGGDRTSPDVAQHGSGAAGGASTLRTVYLPNERADYLVLTIESLQTQLEEQKALMEQRTDQMKEDRRVAIEEAEVREANYKAQLAEAEVQVAKARSNHKALTHEYLSYRHSATVNEHALRHTNHVLVNENEHLKRELADVKARTAIETKALVDAAEKQKDMVISEFRTQVLNREEDTTMAKEQLSMTKTMYGNRVDTLDSRLAKMTKRYNDLERRRKLELEGFSNDIMFMRKQINNMETAVYRLRMPGDGYDEGILHTAPIKKVDAIVTEMRSMKSRMENIERSLKNMRYFRSEPEVTRAPGRPAV